MKVAQVSGIGRVWNLYPPDILDRDDYKVTVAGGECALLKTSFGLAALGHDVTVYAPVTKEWEGKRYKGVLFKPEEDCGEVTEGFDGVVSWSNTKILEMCSESTRRVFSQQLNEMPRDPAFWDSCDVIASPSKEHATLLAGYAPAGAQFKFVIMPSGLDTRDYSAQLPMEKRKNIVSYWSSPDRGLHHLLAMWPDVLERVPDAELHVFYHVDRIIKLRKEIGLSREGFATNIWDRAPIYALTMQALAQLRTTTPQTYFHGPVNRAELAPWQMKTKVYAYPYDPLSWTEGWSQSTGEAYAAGARVVARPADALEEVHGPAVRWVRADVVNPEWRVRFIDAIVEALTAETWPEDAGRAALLAKYTWANAAERLQRALTADLGRR